MTYEELQPISLSLFIFLSSYSSNKKHEKEPMGDHEPKDK